MKNPINSTSIVLAGVLMAATVAPSLLNAQEPAEPREQTRVFTFESRGSQLGVTVRDLEAADLAGTVTGGVRIDEVQPDSPAAASGLQPGDIVTTFDQERVRSTRQFSRLVQETPDGRTVGVEILRDGQRQTLQVTPERRAAHLEGDGPWPHVSAFRFEELEPRLRDLEPRLRELEPRLRELEPRLREELRRLEPRLRELEPRLREMEPEIRKRLDEIERMLRQLLEKDQD